jgi:hypothetical protein
MPVAPAVRPEREPDPRLRLESSPEMVLSPGKRRRPRRGWGGWVSLGLAAAVILGVCGAVGYALYWLATHTPPTEANDDTPAVRKSEGNFAFDPPAGWKYDEKLQRQSLHINCLAMSRKKPRNHFGLRYRDYKVRTPSDAEMLDEALKVLRNDDSPFRNVSYEDPFTGENKGRTGTLGGEPAIVFPFVATGKDEVSMTGEVFMLTRQGYAYWFFFWGPEDDVDQLRAGWANVRNGFKLFNKREGWKPHPRETERFGSDSGYHLDYVTFTPPSRGDQKLRLWRKEENPKDYDDKCELALKGFEPTEEDTGAVRVVPYAGKLAVVRVLVLDQKSDDKDPKATYNAAEAHVLKKVQDESNRPEAKFEPQPDPKSSKVDVGALRGQVSHLRIQLDVDNERYGVLAVAPLSGEKVLVIFCDCRFDRRDFWKQEFKAVIETVRRGK